VTSLTTSLDSIWRSIVATLAFILVMILLASAIHPSGLIVLTVAIWFNILLAVAAGLFLILRANRPIAGAGAIVAAAAVWLAFFLQEDKTSIVWTVCLIVGVALIVYGTRADTLRPGAWPLLLTRLAFGWAWIDNAQDHFRTGWLPGGAPYVALAKAAVDRKPAWFLDPLYQSFAAGTIVPNKDLWAGLTCSGELTFGFLLVVGLFGSFAATGLLWHSLNYILVKGVVVHGAYTDKVFFAADLLSLVTAAGLIYGLDASLQAHVPAGVAETLMGAPSKAGELTRQPQARPGLGPLPAG
jgi:hypothetical protein